MSNYGHHISSENESYFTIDTETIGNTDMGITTNISMVYVNMPKLIEVAGEDGILSIGEFGKNVRLIDLYPSRKDQESKGRLVGGSALKFWETEYKISKVAQNDGYTKYIEKMMKESDDKLAVADVIDKLHNFIKVGVDESVSHGMKDKDIPFVERGGGFDTNKFYTMRDSVLTGFEKNDSIYIPHWARRELRTILSTNKWRDIGTFVTGTNWSKEFTNMVVDNVNMVKHMALFDALLDAYGIYCLKLTQHKFYL